MKKSIRMGHWVGLIALAGMCTAASVHAATARLVADSYTLSTSPANKGKDKKLFIQGPPANPSPQIRKAYMQFDLSTLPGGLSGAQVSKATLRLFVSKTTKAGSFDVVRLTSAWNEFGITGFAAPTEGTTEVSAVPLTLTDKTVFKTIDVTAVVRDWIDGVLTNNGLALVPNVVDGIGAQLDSKESTGNSQVPELEITLVGGLATSTGNMNLANSTASTGNILKEGVLFLHNYGSTTNTFLGHSAGNTSMTGTLNTVLGRESLLSNTSGEKNTTVGVNTLRQNTTGSSNTAVGLSALGSNTTGSRNSAFGLDALFNNTTASFNTAVGYAALALNTTGPDNTAIGYEALRSNTTGGSNTAVGRDALRTNTTGVANVAVGFGALTANTTGLTNTAVGQLALADATTAIGNTALGYGALNGLTTGGNNIGIGSGAGQNWTVTTGNIAIGNPGNFFDSDTIRIGNSQDTTYIAGIHGATSTSGITVFVNSSGRLGTTTSSKRFKTDIRDIGATSSKLMKLRPVSFRYKKDIDPEGILQYGLIAEEVAKVYPDLIVKGEDGKPYTIRYHLLTALLLNELQKQNHEQVAQKDQISALREQNTELDKQIGALREQNDELRKQNVALRDWMGKVDSTLKIVAEGVLPNPGATSCGSGL